MDANRHLRKTRDESGQSLLEFLLMLPVMIGTVVILMRVNTAIQMSIVNQQYARAQALFINHHSAEYPRLKHYPKFLANSTNQMVIGVSDNNLSSEDSDGSEYVPSASAQIISRTRKLAGSDGQAGEIPQLRGNVRIRNTVSLCTQSIVMKGAGGVQLVASNLPEMQDPKAFLYCTSKLSNMETLKP